MPGRGEQVSPAVALPCAASTQRPIFDFPLVSDSLNWHRNGSLDHEKGELQALAVPPRTRDLISKLLGDKGYIAQALGTKLYGVRGQAAAPVRPHRVAP